MMKEARACFWIAGGVFAIFVADILVAKIQVLSGATIPRHLGDTPQFLVLLIAVTFFVAGTLMREKDEREREEEGVPPPEDGAPQGRQ
jgi:hypothetical protein